MFHSQRKDSLDGQSIMNAKAEVAEAPYINMQHRVNDALGSISWAVMVLPRNDLLRRYATPKSGSADSGLLRRHMEGK